MLYLALVLVLSQFIFFGKFFHTNNVLSCRLFGCRNHQLVLVRITNADNGWYVINELHRFQMIVRLFSLFLFLYFYNSFCFIDDVMHIWSWFWYVSDCIYRLSSIVWWIRHLLRNHYFLFKVFSNASKQSKQVVRLIYTALSLLDFKGLS